LIITRHVLGVGIPTDIFAYTNGLQWNPANTFGNWNFNGPARQRMVTFWNQMGSDVRAIARNVNIPADFRISGGGAWAPGEHQAGNPNLTTNPIGSTGMTSPLSTTATNATALFQLSLIEAGVYFTSDQGAQPSRRTTCVNGQVRHWWLRSPGTTTGVTGDVASVSNTGNRTTADANMATRGIRPAVWVMP